MSDLGKAPLPRQSELELLRAELETARRALAERKVVERAKGVLMTALQLSEPEAHRRLQLEARRHNLRLVEVARRVVEHEALFDAAKVA